MKIIPITTKVFQEGKDIIRFITAHVRHLKECSVLVVTSKIVALAECRTAIIEDDQTKERLIRAESELALPTKYCWLTVKDGMVMASAGIDESNGNGKLILLPKDSFRSARFLRRVLRHKYGIRRLGVVITDSRIMPLRTGVTAVAVGYAGLRGIRDYRGTPDIFGRKFRMSQTNVVDSIATAAVLVMGEGNEQRPLAVIEDAPVEFCDKIRRNELHIELEDDMYRPFFDQLPRE